MIGEERNLRRGNRRRMRALLTKENPAGGHDPPSSHQMSQQLGCVSIRWLEQTNRDLKGKTCQELTAADFPGTRKMAVSCICFLKTTYVAQPITNGCAMEQMLCCIDSRSTIPSRYRRILADSVLHWYEFPPPGVRLLLLSLFCRDHGILANNRCPFDWEDFHADCVGNEPSLNLQCAANP